MSAERTGMFTGNGWCQMRVWPRKITCTTVCYEHLHQKELEYSEDSNTLVDANMD